MADTMQFDLVSPEKSLASLAAREVQIPGSEGDMTAMPDHAPTITTLRPGILTVVSDGGSSDFAVTGGFAEITATATSVLAEHAIPASEITAEMVDGYIAEAETAAAEATSDVKDLADKMLADMRALKASLGL